MPSSNVIINSILLGLISVGLILQWSTNHTYQRTGLVVFIIGLLSEFLVNQHRIQAWAYQACLISLFLIPVKDATSVRLAILRLRWLVISVYFFSCISKLDATFVNSLGPSMLDTLLEYTGTKGDVLPAWLRHLFVLSLPISEGIIGLGLVFKPTVRASCFAAVAMHLSLIVIVGPWGLQHEWGVVVWNCFFIVQVIVLFWPNRHRFSNSKGMKVESDLPDVQVPTVAVEKFNTNAADVTARLAFLSSLIFPIFAWIDVADHWPSWELYAPRTSRVEIWISANDSNQLPDDISRYLSTANSDGWQRLDAAAWSLGSQNAPIYPEDRFQVGVALSLRNWLSNERSIRVQWRGTANRWTGERETKWLSGFDQLNQFATTFRLNATPYHESNARQF